MGVRFPHQMPEAEDGLLATINTTPAITPELKELAKMSAWRLAHLDWSEQTERQLTVFFSTTTGQPRTAPITPQAQ